VAERKREGEADCGEHSIVDDLKNAATASIAKRTHLCVDDLVTTEG
jgi:hypothetical protein